MNILSIKTTCIGGHKQDRLAARQREQDTGFDRGTSTVSDKTLSKLKAFKALESRRDAIGDLTRKYGVNLPGADAVRILTDDATLELLPQLEVVIQEYKEEAKQFINNWDQHRQMLLDSCVTATALEKMAAAIPIEPPRASRFTAEYTLLPISETAIGAILDDEIRIAAKRSFNAATKIMADDVLDAIRGMLEEQYDRLLGKDREGNFKRMTSSHMKATLEAFGQLKGVLSGNVSDPDLLDKMEDLQAWGQTLKTSHVELRDTDVKAQELDKYDSILTLLNPDHVSRVSVAPEPTPQAEPEPVTDPIEEEHIADAQEASYRDKCSDLGINPDTGEPYPASWNANDELELDEHIQDLDQSYDEAEQAEAQAQPTGVQCPEEKDEDW